MDYNTTPLFVPNTADLMMVIQAAEQRDGQPPFASPHCPPAARLHALARSRLPRPFIKSLKSRCVPEAEKKETRAAALNLPVHTSQEGAIAASLFSLLNKLQQIRRYTSTLLSSSLPLEQGNICLINASRLGRESVLTSYQQIDYDITK